MPCPQSGRTNGVKSGSNGDPLAILGLEARAASQWAEFFRLATSSSAVRIS